MRERKRGVGRGVGEREREGGREHTGPDTEKLALSLTSERTMRMQAVQAGTPLPLRSLEQSDAS
eukprot:4129157-Pleurochrysis_carterae.AAC.1